MQQPETFLMPRDAFSMAEKATRQRSQAAVFRDRAAECIFGAASNVQQRSWRWALLPDVPPGDAAAVLGAEISKTPGNFPTRTTTVPVEHDVELNQTWLSQESPSSLFFFCQHFGLSHVSPQFWSSSPRVRWRWVPAEASSRQRWGQLRHTAIASRRMTGAAVGISLHPAARYASCTGEEMWRVSAI